MKKLLILILLIFVSCSDVNSNSSAQETTSTTSLQSKLEDECKKWNEGTNEILDEINYQLESFFSAVGRGDLTSSWFKEFRQEDKVSNAITLQKEINNEYGEVMMGRQKLNVSTALKLYAEAFDHWEQGILEDNLEVFNSGTYDYKQAERFLDDYKIVYESSTGKEVIFYEFSQYCLISG